MLFVMATILDWLDPRFGHSKMGSENKDIPTGGKIGRPTGESRIIKEIRRIEPEAQRKHSVNPVI